jgi:hexosaminidase
MTPSGYCYFDYPQNEKEDSVTIGAEVTNVKKVYSYEPVSKQLDSMDTTYVLGAQGNVWTEFISNPAKVEYMVFPRMTALSDVLWSQKNYRNWDDFESRMKMQFKRYDLWKVHYSKAMFDSGSSITTIIKSE